jgi:hypothetical protein
MATKAWVATVSEGQVVTLLAGPSHKQHHQDFTIGPKCDKDAGRWICVTHDKVFWNPMERDSHTARGTHSLAWFCAHHGPEVP